MNLDRTGNGATDGYPLSDKQLERLLAAIDHLAEALDKQPAAPFPWREVNDPFLIMIAEMMLMRTRADLVTAAFETVRQEYDTPKKLAAATDEEVEALLWPLGLTKRIPFFKRAAVYLQEHHPEGLPRERKALEKIPGVGRYTADAVRAFAFNEPVVPADVNVLRWLSRVTGLPMSNASKGSRELRALLPLLAPLGGRKAYKFLDFLREVCRPRKPQCETCVIRLHCKHGLDTT